jgi:hypothetical protein
MVASSNFRRFFLVLSQYQLLSRAASSKKRSPQGLRFLWNGIVSTRNLAANANNKGNGAMGNVQK